MSDMIDKDDSENEEEVTAPWRNLRVVGTAVICLSVFAVATYAMKALTAGATVIVEADEVATVLMSTGGVRLEEIDGPIVLALRPGRNAVRAGKFRVTGQIEGMRLEFSTGRTLEIKKDDVVRMKIESISLDEESAVE